MWLVSEETVVRELRALLGNTDLADRSYDAIPETHNGVLLNADAARELSPYYRSFAGRLAFTAVTYPPCSNYVFERLMRTLSRPARIIPNPRKIMFLAGGAASGKTSAIGSELIKSFDVVFDSNLADFDKAVKMIEAAIEQDWQIHVTYIHRPFGYAVEDMIRRAIQTGRFIPLGAGPQSLASLHFRAGDIRKALSAFRRYEFRAAIRVFQRMDER